MVPETNTQKYALYLRHFIQAGRNYWHQCLWHKCVVYAATVCAVGLIGMYGIATWYRWSERQKPVVLGASFIADYAQYLGLDPHQTFLAMLNDLHLKHIRLVSYWDNIERTKGAYDFSELDWEMHQASIHNTKVTLAIGLRQPRWPECHMPAWASQEPAAVWEPQLQDFIAAVVNRYKTSLALESYQLENEYFLSAFGTCNDYSRTRFINEATLVRRLDSHHTLIISRSQNAIGWPIHAPFADQYAISIYRRVWLDVLHRYVEYPFPAWYYAFLAGMEKIWSGKDTSIHELQAEPWPAFGKPIPETSLAEQNKSFDATRLQQVVTFGRATGMKTIDLWGAEYWYYRAITLHDPSVWQTAEQLLSSNNSR